MGEMQILILGTADWAQPIATNQHYIARELTREGFASVTFVESMALRRPGFSRRDLARVARRIRSALLRASRPHEGATRPIPKGLTILSPLTIPLHHGLARVVNKIILKRLVADWIRHTGPRILWAYTPVTYGLEMHADLTFYHCVDLLGEFPGIDRIAVDRGERHLSAIGARAIATSEVVSSHLQRQGFKNVTLWENVADVSTFLEAEPLAGKRVAGRVLFAGNLSPRKVDYHLLMKLAEEGLDVRVAGPRAEGGGSDATQFSRLIDAGVEYLGMLDLKDLAQEMVGVTVGLIPYAVNGYTMGVSPLKTYEYLSAGLPVVSTGLPGVHSDGVDVFVEHDHDAFIATVNRLSSVPRPGDVVRRVEKARHNSWSERGNQARSIIGRDLPGWESST